MEKKTKHLVDIYTTDISALQLAEIITKDAIVNSIIVPENRLASNKVKEVLKHSSYPVSIHRKNDETLSHALDRSYFICWFYSQILPEHLLAHYSGGGINMHGGKIPEFRGASVLNWAIAEQENTLGVVWHLVVKEVDAGGIVCEKELPITEFDTAETMRKKIIAAGIEMFPNGWKSLIEGRRPIRYPELKKGKIWPQRKPVDGKIGKNLSSKKVSALIRAQTGPFPSAFIEIDKQNITIGAISYTKVPESIEYETSDGHMIWLIPEHAMSNGS